MNLYRFSRNVLQGTDIIAADEVTARELLKVVPDRHWFVIDVGEGVLDDQEDLDGEHRA